MPQAEQTVEPRLLEPLPDLIRVQAGHFPGTEVFDLESPDGFVGRRLAEDASDWTVYTPHNVDEGPENLETVEFTYTDLGFEDGQLAAVVGAWISDPIQHWSPAFLEELYRVLAPEGRVLFLFRTSSPRNRSVPRQFPQSAVPMLADAGFEHAAERRLHVLPDGSTIVRLRAVKPE